MRNNCASREPLSLSRDVKDVIARVHGSIDPGAELAASTQHRVDKILQRQRLDILAYLAVCELRLFQPK